jgi:hypothetical protein
MMRLVLTGVVHRRTTPRAVAGTSRYQRRATCRCFGKSWYARVASILAYWLDAMRCCNTTAATTTTHLFLHACVVLCCHRRGIRRARPGWCVVEHPIQRGRSVSLESRQQQLGDSLPYRVRSSATNTHQYRHHTVPCSTASWCIAITHASKHTSN